MSAINDLNHSDTLKIEELTYHLEGPSVSEDVSVPGVTVDLGPGLTFALTSDELNLPVPGLTFKFNGTPNPGTTVTWKVDQPLDIWWHGVHINHVSGQITTTLTNVPAVLGQASNGDQRVFKMRLDNTVGDGDELVIKIALVGDATISNITFRAMAGEVLAPVFFNVNVLAARWEQNVCGACYQLRGAQVTLSAVLTDLHAVGNVTETTYKWRIEAGGAHFVTADNGPSVTLVCDEAGPISVCVDVVVSTDIETGTYTGKIKFNCLTEEEAGLVTLLCKLRQELMNTRRVIPGIGPGTGQLVDPLWDPAPDMLHDGMIRMIMTRSYSQGELRQIHRSAERIMHNASSLLEFTKSLIGKSEARLKLSGSHPKA